MNNLYNTNTISNISIPIVSKFEYNDPEPVIEQDRLRRLSRSSESNVQMDQDWLFQINHVFIFTCIFENT